MFLLSAGAVEDLHRLLNIVCSLTQLTAGTGRPHAHMHLASVRAYAYNIGKEHAQ